MEQMLKDIKEKVDNLEYKEIKPLKDEVYQLQTNLAINSTLIQQCAKTNENLDKTLGSVRDSMLKINSSLEHSNEKVDELGTKMDNMQDKFNKDVGKLNERVTGVDNKVTSVDNKTMIDTSTTLKGIFKNALMWLFGGSAIGVVVAYVVSNMN